jgi:O-acetyl-ADP-ribose deacetylase (regulator of RNase III)
MYRATVPYLRKSLRKLAQWAVKEKPRSVGLPKIGAGLGKLSWTGDVRPLMIEHLAPPETLFVVYETYLPEG